jgi:hypothetical protein
LTDKRVENNLLNLSDHNERRFNIFRAMGALIKSGEKKAGENIVTTTDAKHHTDF